MVATYSEALRHSLLKPNGQKTRVPMTESHLIQQSTGIKHPMKITDDAF
jgi:hypothetical protein